MPGNGTDYIAEHLRSQGFLVTVSGWVPGQLYVVADSPRTIAASLPPSHSFAVKQYVRISEEERQAVEHSCSKLPNPGWVRIKYGKYKGDIGYVFDSEQSNGLVSILIALRDFPYPMPGGSVALLDQYLLPNDQAVRDILRDGKVVGCSYRSEQYYMGLLVKKFHHDRLEIVASPHADDIKLHIQSGWDTPFVRKSLLAFSMQFLRTGDLVRIIAGEIRSKIGTVISTDHASGSVRLETNFDSHQREIDVRLEDVERIFRVGDEIRVVAGPYLGLEGHIIQISDDTFHICQAVSKEEVGFTHKLQSCDSLTHFIGTCFEILLGSSPLASRLSPAATHAAAL
jgi:ribosomal protein L24